MHHIWSQDDLFTDSGKLTSSTCGAWTTPQTPATDFCISKLVFTTDLCTFKLVFATDFVFQNLVFVTEFCVSKLVIV